MKLKNKTWIHILLWGLMILYLFISPVIKDHFSVVQGKPVSVDGATPEATDLINYGLEGMIKVRLAGQMLHQVQGWSFIDSGVDQNAYEIFLVLARQGDRYFYPVIMKDSAKVKKDLPGVKPNPSNSGFECLIARETLKNGIYDVSILFIEKTSGKSYQRLTNKILIKTHNTFQLLYRLKVPE